MLKEGSLQQYAPLALACIDRDRALIGFIADDYLQEGAEAALKEALERNGHEVFRLACTTMDKAPNAGVIDHIAELYEVAGADMAQALRAHDHLALHKVRESGEKHAIAAVEALYATCDMTPPEKANALDRCGSPADVPASGPLSGARHMIAMARQGEVPARLGPGFTIRKLTNSSRQLSQSKKSL